MESKLSLNLIKNWQALCKEIVFTDIAPLLLQNKVITVDEYRHITSQAEETGTENLLLLLLKKSDQVLNVFGDCLEKDYSWLAEKLKEGCCKEEGRDETDATPITRLEMEQDIEKENSSRDICGDCHNLNSMNNHEQLNNRINNNKYRSVERRRLPKTRVKNRLKSHPKVHNADAEVTSSTELPTPVLNEEVTDEAVKIIRRDSLVSKSWTTIAHSLGLTDRVHDIRCKVILHGEDLNMCIVYLIQNWLERCPKVAKLSKLIDVLRSEGFNGVADNLTEILFGKPDNVSVKVN